MGPQRTIAIIHKDPNLIKLLSMMTSLDYNALTMLVDTNTNPAQVVHFVDKTGPDLVLLAENYGGTNSPKEGEGIEALIQLRQGHPTMPIFMVSGGKPNYERAMQSGASGYLNIPMDIDSYREFLGSNIQS